MGLSDWKPRLWTLCGLYGNKYSVNALDYNDDDYDDDNDDNDLTL